MPYSILPSDVNIAKLEHRKKLLSLILPLENKINTLVSDRNIWLWINGFTFNQRKQHVHYMSDLYRYYYVFGENERIARRIEEKIGLPYRNFLTASLGIHAEFLKINQFKISKSYFETSKEKLQNTL